MCCLRTILVLSLICTGLVASQNYNTDVEEINKSFSGTIAASLVDWITRAIQYLTEFMDIKNRATRFLMSLYTSENLALVKRILGVALRFGEWVNNVIPDSTSDVNNMFLSFLYPQLNGGSVQPEKNRGGVTGLDPIGDWPSWSENTRRYNDFGGRNDVEQQVLDLHTLLNGRGRA